jgi:hypothetical protein
MNHPSKISAFQAKRTPDMSIEWEAPPSLSHLLNRREAEREDLPVWAETMPASLDMLQPAPGAFHEALEGLAVREVDEPEIFRALFGAQAAASAAR